MQTTHIRFFDLVKAIACNLIVLHHLAFYGPMSDHVRPILPEVIEWLEEHARIAVHAFLAIGGFLAAKSLSKTGAGPTRPFRAILRRFAKLAPPFIVAMALAVAASALASQWMTHDSISPIPTLAQFGAHALLLQDVLGVESLSAGAWYVAIDFQLYALLTLLLWLAGRSGGYRWIAPTLVAVGTGASLLVFNRNPELDNWAPYFLGSYGLGALAWWASERQRGAASATMLAGSIILLGATALGIDFRSRIAVALAISVAMVAVCRGMLSVPGQNLAITGFLGRISYAVFLVHFPVSLLVNAAFTRFAPAQADVQAAGMLVAWLACIVAGAAFYRWVELPLSALTNPAPAGRNAGSVRPIA
jgi:peptidoglycan/LPS O-acetylase OafA/YrhL